MKNKNTSIMYPLSFRRRVTAALMALFMLLQICVPGIAAAAILITDDKITSDIMANYQFQPSSSREHLYEQAVYLSQTAPVQNATVASFHKQIVAAKAGLPKPSYVPIAGDITLFIPVHLLGKVVGDIYVQNRFIRSQITELLGRHMIDTELYDSELAQINVLYANAFTFIKSNGQGYVFGGKLPADLVISQDMVWPELRIINGEKVLVPVVYLTQNTLNTRGVKDHTIEFAGTSAEFAGIILDKTTLLTRRNTFIKTVGDIVNNGGKISAQQSLTLDVGGTLKNISGTVSAADNLTIIANQIYNKTVVHPFKDRNGSGTRLGEIAGFESANGSIHLRSTNDIIFEGATATAANGGISFNAGGNIAIAGVKTEYQSAYTEGHWQVNQSSLEVFGSRLTAKETISLIAGGAITISASELVSTEGGIELLAKQGIHILDELNQEQIQKLDRKGKTTGQSSEFRTEAVRAVLSAGKGVLLDTEFGDVVLKASKITSGTGAQVNARNGKVHLLMTKELEEFHLSTVRKSTWTIKTRTEDIVHENNIQNAIVGGLQVQAMHGIEVEYTGKEGATLAEQIEEYRSMPGLSWMADLYDQAVLDGGQGANWAAMEEIHQELRKSKSSLSPAAMAIIAICMAVVMGPGAGLIGQSGLISTAVGGGAFGAAMSAGALTLTTQAAQSLASGNNLRETLSTFDSNDSLKSLAVSMVTAGAMQHTNLKMFQVADDASTAVALAQQTGQAVVDATVRAGISVTINGGNSDDYLNAFNSSLVSSAINSIGSKVSNHISGAASFDEASKYIAHAAMGCMTSTLTTKLESGDVETACVSGAGGAVISQLLTSDTIEEKLREWGANLGADGVDYTDIEEQAKYFQSLGVDIAKLASGLTAFALGGDVNAAAGSAEMVAKSNVYKAVNLLELYRELNGDVFMPADSPRAERVMAKYEAKIRDELAAKGVSSETAENIIAKFKASGLLASIGAFEDALVGDGRSFDEIAISRAEDTFGEVANSGGDIEELSEIRVTGTPFSEVSSHIVQFLGATNSTVNMLTPDEQKAVGIAFNALTGGPIKSAISEAVSYGVDKLMPPELANAMNEMTVIIGTSGVAYLVNRGYEQVKGEYPDVTEEAGIFDVKDWVDGLTWLAENVTGLPGRRGTNTPTHVYANSNGDSGNTSDIVGPKVIVPSQMRLRDDFDEHTVKVDRINGKYKRDGKGGLSGGHNQNEFLTAMENPRSFSDAQLNDRKLVKNPGDEKGVILSESDVKDAAGNIVGKHYTYRIPSTNSDGSIEYDKDTGAVVYLKGNPTPIKSVYDPSKISDADYLAAAKRASQRVYTDNGQNFVNDPKKHYFDQVDTQTGWKFRVFFAMKDNLPTISNAHIVSH